MRAPWASWRQCSLQVHSPAARLHPLLVAGIGPTRQCSQVCTHASFIMPHADADMLVKRAPCVCRESLLLLISSIDAAETQLEAATHRPRAFAAALSVVGVAQAARIASPRVLVVLLLGVVAHLGHVGALRDGGVGQDGVLSVCSDRTRCQWSPWARVEPQ